MKLVNPLPPKEQEKSNGKKGDGSQKVKKVEFRLELSPRKILVWVLVLFFALSFVSSLFRPGITAEEINLTQALNDIKEGKVQKILIDGDRLILNYKDEKQFFTRKEPGESLVQTFQAAGIDPKSVEIKVVDQTMTKAVADILGGILPLVLMAVFFYFIFRQARGAQDSIFSFGQSRAKLFAKGKQPITFKDVAGVDEAKKELEEVVDFLKHPQKYRALGARTPKGVLLVGPSGVGKCVVGDTLVWTNKGLIEIQDIPRYYYVRENGLVEGAMVDSFMIESVHSMASVASHWYDLGESDTYRITTNLGHEIEGTPEHPLVVMGEDGNLRFKAAKEIKVGDYLPIKTGSQMFGNYRRLDKEQSYILGLLTGDGGMTIKDRICFTTADRELLEACKNYFQSRYSYQLQKTKSRKHDYVISSAQIKSELLQSGLSENYSRNKKIPDQIMMAPKEQVVAFLQGLFDADGSVYKTGKVEFSTSSKKLAKQVSALLLNLGVMHKFRVKKNNQYANSYVLLISGVDLVNFSRQVGFRLPRKQEKINSYLAKMRSKTNVDLFPAQGTRILRLWRYLVESDKKPSKYVDENFHKQICKYARSGRKPSRESLKLFLEACVKADPTIEANEDFRFLWLLVNSGLFFDRVSKVEKSQGRVYDFTVPQTHSFVSNGFISHNTLLAKAVAGEAGVPFFSMAGSEFMEMLVGVGASRVRDLFATAKRAAPSIIFIDEIDAIGRQRGVGGFVGGHDEREQTLNQILVEMDGFTPNDNVIVIAATNRGDLLDPALLRPGRFDRRVVLDMPDLEGRKAILAIHARGKKFAKSVDWEKVAKRTVGFSGADLENMLNEAAILAARLNKKEIDERDLEEAAVKVKLGPERKRLQSEEDKRLTAYHEAGHAVVNFFCPHADPVHRISIVARGMSLGHTLIAPLKDRTQETKTRLLEQIRVMMGGRVAEEITFGEMTTGAANDIAQATRIARAMVVDFGMSNLGPISLGPQPELGDFGRVVWYDQTTISPEMQYKIDQEVKKIIDEAYKEAKKVLLENRDKLDKIVEALLKKETMEEEEFKELMK